MTSTPTRSDVNVVITMKDLQDRHIHIIHGTTVENKGILIITETFKLKITNTFFCNTNIHWYTWKRTSLNQKSIIGFKIIKQKQGSNILDARIKRGPNFGSDHYLVTAKLVYPFRHLNQNNWKSHEKSKTQEIHQYNLHLLQQESIRQLYQNQLNEKLITRKWRCQHRKL